MEEGLRTRQPAVAGSFYPAEPEALRATVERLLSENPCPGTPPKAVIVPHAALTYSGAAAARAFNLLATARGRIERVVMLGPTHRVPVPGLALPEADRLLTPLGPMPVASGAGALLEGFDQVIRSEEAHRREHCLEVQLPFLQVALGDCEILPFLVGPVAPDVVAPVLEAVWGGPETAVLVSSDLSHSHDDETARQLDGETCAQILSLASTLDPDQACGAFAVNGLTQLARRRRLRVRELARCNSADRGAPRDRVVGYAAFAFDPDEEP